jgi:hypothetical protein
MKITPRKRIIRIRIMTPISRPILPADDFFLGGASI